MSEGVGSMIQCGYCGNWHTYSYEMCKDIHNRPPAPAIGNLCPSSWPVVYSQADMDKLKADHLAEIAEKERELKRAKGYDLRMGDDYGDDPIECVVILKREITRLKEGLKELTLMEPRPFPRIPSLVGLIAPPVIDDYNNLRNSILELIAEIQEEKE
jgi:hypothetical protein